MPSSDLWAFSLAVYDEPAVQKECLELQDRYGIDVNLLLFCVFVGAAHGAVLAERDIGQAAGVVRDWHENVVGALRAARRGLKPFATGPSPTASGAETLRNDVKAAEREAERLEQMMLERWCLERVDSWPRAEPIAAIAANIRALFAVRAVSGGHPDLPDRLMASALAAVHFGPAQRRL